MKSLARILVALPLVLLVPVLVVIPLLLFALEDLLYFVLRPKAPPRNSAPRRHAASVVIPSWNARDLLEKYLWTVVEAASHHPGSEVIVVDNGSTDGTADFLRESFPTVRVLALDRNLGFGGGSNAGFRAAENDIVVLLNNDMRVEPDFLGPLLDGFEDEGVFAVSCQIFFSDPQKVREETGLTQAWWSAGSLRVRHRIDSHVTRRFPCFYAGGGSSAFDRRKFLELGGFDPLLAPFYLEDTDLGYLAWKRGWKVLYEPDSKVYHEHRGTIGKRYSPARIQTVLQKNFLLFTWKNIHEWSRLFEHFGCTLAGTWVSLVAGNSPERPSLAGLWKAFLQLPAAARSRWRARKLAAISDTEAFRRPLGAYFQDRFGPLDPNPALLRVLFVSPYPICPPVHGGAVFMLQTCRQLARLTELHLVVLLDRVEEAEAHRELAGLCASAEFVVRATGQPKRIGSITPHAIHEFASPDLDWLIHRKIAMDRIDVLQLEYLPMGQYAGQYRRLATFLFEHDVYFQSIARALPRMRGLWEKAGASFEYMRALRYELRLLPRFDRVQVCSAENRAYLAGFLPTVRGRLDDNLRAGIEVSRYTFREEGREPYTMLFLGSFRHRPNLDALEWFVQGVLPRVLAARPQARLIVVGSEPPVRLASTLGHGAVDFQGPVDDVREPLSRYAVFVCPILSGSGVRVKLLEAFAAGIPAVSTPLGAEGLAVEDGRLCALAGDAETFAAKVMELFDHPDRAHTMARRAREEIGIHRDISALTGRLVDVYRAVVTEKRDQMDSTARSKTLPSISISAR